MQSDLVPLPGLYKQLQVVHRLGCNALEDPLQLLELVLHFAQYYTYLLKGIK